LRQTGLVLSTPSVERVVADYGLQKKLYACGPRPGANDAKSSVESQHSKNRIREAPSNPVSIERGVRQLLTDKVSGHLVGIGLLVAVRDRLVCDRWKGFHCVSIGTRADQAKNPGPKMVGNQSQSPGDFLPQIFGLIF
jgi:hypothetical protein